MVRSAEVLVATCGAVHHRCAVWLARHVRARQLKLAELEPRQEQGERGERWHQRTLAALAGASLSLARAGRRTIAAALLIALPLRGTASHSDGSASSATRPLGSSETAASFGARAQAFLMKIASVSPSLPAPAREHAPVLAIAAACAALLLIGLSMSPGETDQPETMGHLVQAGVSAAGDTQTPSAGSSAPAKPSGDATAEALQEELARAQRRIEALEAENLLLTAIAQGMTEIAQTLNRRLDEAGFQTEEVPALPAGSQRESKVRDLRRSSSEHRQ